MTTTQQSSTPADAVQYLRNIVKDVLPMLRGENYSKTADLLEKAVADLSPAIQPSGEAVAEIRLSSPNESGERFAMVNTLGDFDLENFPDGTKLYLRAPAASNVEAVPRTPTDAMLVAARDWSVGKLGRGVGNDAATGCWQAMYDAARPSAPIEAGELPPLPRHPEKYGGWLKSEAAAITTYGQLCRDTARPASSVTSGPKCAACDGSGWVRDVHDMEQGLIRCDKCPVAATKPASKDAEAGELPPLPKCKMLSGPALDSLHVLYTADQMHTYARAALARQSAPSAVPEGLTEEDIDAIWNAMPGGPAGWLKSFGYSQFAREIEAAILDGYAAPTTATSSKESAECQFPLCKGEVEQQRIASDVHAELYGKASAPAGSIGEDPEFCRLMEVLYCAEAEHRTLDGEAGSANLADEAEMAVVEYINRWAARPAVGMVAAPEDDAIDHDATAELHAILAQYPPESWAVRNRAFEEAARFVEADKGPFWTVLAAGIRALKSAAPDMSVRDAVCQLLDDLIKLWDAESVSEDDHNEELCRIEDAIRALRSAPIGADQGAKDAN